MKTLLQKLYSGELDPTKYYVPKNIEFWKQDEAVNNILKKYDPNGMLIGEASCTKDLIQVTNHYLYPHVSHRKRRNVSARF